MCETPGQRLHAALLTHGFGIAGWDGLSEGLREGMEAAAREYDGDRAISDRLDALAAEVAALRRDRGMDLAAMAEVGDRLAILESSKENVGSWLLSFDGWRRTQEALGPFARHSEIDDCETRLARCEGRHGEIIERLTQLERQRDADRREAVAAERRVAELEARVGAIDGSVAPRERDGVHVERWCPHCGETVRLDAVLRAKGKGGGIDARLAALEARAIDGGDPLRRKS